MIKKIVEHSKATGRLGIGIVGKFYGEKKTKKNTVQFYKQLLGFKLGYGIPTMK